MRTAILTGFQVFGRYTVNPTELLARYLDDKILAEHRIHTLVFPPTVLSPVQPPDYGKAIIEKASAVNASVIISLGIASEAKGVRIEKVCVNWVENDTYCTAFENRRPVFTDRKARQRRRVPLRAWNFGKLSEKLLAKNIPLEMSTDAGRYCCNALMVRVLRALEDRAMQLPFLFAHVPCTAEAIVAMPDFDRVNKVLWRQEKLLTVVEALLESYRL